MKIFVTFSALIMLALPIVGLSQGAGGAAGAASRQEPTEDLRMRNSLSQSEIKRLAEQIDQWNRVDGAAGVPPRVARSRAGAMLTVLKVSCVVSDAAYRGQAPDDTGTHIYEAACEDGMGYLLMLQDSNLRGIACLATGREESPVKCALPANDTRVIAETVLRRHRIECKVRESKWLGINASNLEHVEAACEAGEGYVIRNPQPGSPGQLEVSSCQDAIKQGVACELTSHAGARPEPAADARPDLAWFKEALARNGVECQTKRARVVGRESTKRRYVVEFECANRPEGLIAIVPAAGDAVNPFESMNCVSAAARAIRCELLSGPKE